MAEQAGGGDKGQHQNAKATVDAAGQIHQPSHHGDVGHRIGIGHGRTLVLPLRHQQSGHNQADVHQYPSIKLSTLKNGQATANGAVIQHQLAEYMEGEQRQQQAEAADVNQAGQFIQGILPMQPCCGFGHISLHRPLPSRLGCLKG